MGSMLTEIQNKDKSLNEDYLAAVDASAKMGFDVYPGWIEEKGLVAIWNTDDVISGTYIDFLKFGRKRGAHVVYAHRSLLSLEETLGASVEEIADSYIGLPEYQEEEELGFDLGSAEDITNLEGLALFVEFCWLADGVLHIYREENEPLLNLLEYLETQLAVNHDEEFDDEAVSSEK